MDWVVYPYRHPPRFRRSPFRYFNTEHTNDFIIEAPRAGFVTTEFVHSHVTRHNNQEIKQCEKT